jgi:hypothetical protein
MDIRSIAKRLCLIVAALLVSPTFGVKARGPSFSARNVAAQIGVGHPRAVSWFATAYEQLGEYISWSTCGYTSTSSGCYGGGTIGPFARPCSIASSGSGVYVLDSGISGGHAILYIYRQVSSSTPSVTLLRQVELPALDGSGTAQCALAAVGSWVYAGHDESIYYARVRLSDYSVRMDNCGAPITSITASGNAVVVSSDSNCQEWYDNNGTWIQGGGAGSDVFVLNPTGRALP